MGRLDGKVCLVTGGTSGIGRSTVELFVREGAKVMFCGRGEEVGRQIESELGERAAFLRVDVTDEQQVKVLVDAVISKWGQLDCLFNNAGGGVAVPGVEKVTQEHIRATFSLNFDSMAMATKYAVPHLKKQPTAAIINNSSVAGLKAGFGDVLYSAAKAAIDGYTRSAAMELARHGIRMNSIAPGAIATPIFWGGSPGHARGKKLTAEDNRKRQEKVEANIVNNVVPLRIGRSGTGIDIAEAALFLASDAGSWVTGQTWVVDGGMTVFDAPNKGWMADDPPVDPVPRRAKL
mmetsp:Transcript_92072/g.210801  ORF Transcript_92072/g.210801 Transcript_92072/m.210801 type:complete len:291 (-) Transcript_92072:202-1074(-)